ncbi:LOW QUALITY PROTEIN: uncharacterized protein LOC135475040 [Liolophura sinensis]|uniref:LOW QUALITY PROTEIN: uncharacterized protein LOC135475040 n=1 Tax=Liolophura sinensis TaxID=3198878 RepID=UPI00315844FA
MNNNVIHIVPEEAILLDVRSKFPCTVEGCDKTLSNYGALRMHLVKTHKHYQNEEDRALGLKLKRVDKTTYLYHCPVKSCPKHKYNGQANSYFTSMKLLKQHYGKLHAEKKFRCEKCGRGFGLERDKRRHEETCGFLLQCNTCQCPYSTVEAMLTHCRRKNHDPPEECVSKKKIKEREGKAKKNLSVDQDRTKATPSIIFINMLPTQSDVPGNTTPGASTFRHILPKPSLQKTVPYTTVTMANGQFLVTQENLEPRQNVDTQTDRRLTEQGTSIATDLFCAAAVRHAKDAEAMISPGRRDAEVSVSPRNREIGTSMTDLCAVDYIKNHQSIDGCRQISDLSNNNVSGINNRPNQQDNYNVQYNPISSSFIDSGHNNSQSPFGMSPGDSVCSTKGMQTLMSLPLRSELSIAVAETQTPGDYILKQAMASAHISLAKESKGSQVSPRAKIRGHAGGIAVNSQSCQTSRLSEHHKSPKRKRHRKCASGDCAVNNRNKSLSWKGDRVSNRSQASSNYLASLSAGESVGSSSQGLLTGVLSHAGNSCLVRGAGNNVGVRTRHLSSTASTTTTMLIDGPHNEDIPGSLAEFDDLTDHQTQTIDIFENLNAAAASISTQTPQSYLAQPNEIGTQPEGANLQHSHTQTFVSAFTAHAEQVRSFEGALENPVLSAQLKTFEGAGKTLGYASQTRLPGRSTLNPVLAGQTSDDDESVPDTFETSCGTGAALSDFSEVDVQPRITFTNSDVQTSATDLLNLLDMGVQADSGPGTTIQTQTDVDEMGELFCHNMETQTASDLFLQDLEFSDIQIQTNLDLECLEDSSSTVETQTMWHSAAAGSARELSDMQTQTLFPTNPNFDPDLTDSHTQTPWEDITSLILQDL